MSKDTAKKSSKQAANNSFEKPASSDKPKFEFKPNIEIMSIIAVFLSIIVLLGVIFSSGGIFGQAIGTFMKGLFGLGAYILPIITIVYCISLFFSEEKKINVPKFLLSILLFLLFIGFVHLLSREQQTFATASDYVKAMYSNGDMVNGGLIGACMGDMFHYILGGFGSFLLFFSAMVCCIILITGKSLSDTILNIKNSLSSYMSYELSSKDDEPEPEYDDDYIEEVPSKRKKRSLWSSIVNFFTQEVESEEDDLYPPDEELSKTENFINEKIVKEEPDKEDNIRETEEKADISKNISEKNTENNSSDTFAKSERKSIVIRTDDGKRYKELKPPVVITIRPDYEKRSKGDLKIAVDEIASARLIRRRKKAAAKKPDASLPEFLAKSAYAAVWGDTSFEEFTVDNTTYFAQQPVYCEEYEPTDEYYDIPFEEVERLFSVDTQMYPMEMAKPVQFLSSGANENTQAQENEQEPVLEESPLKVHFSDNGNTENFTAEKNFYSEISSYTPEREVSEQIQPEISVQKPAENSQQAESARQQSYERVQSSASVQPETYENKQSEEQILPKQVHYENAKSETPSAMSEQISPKPQNVPLIISPDKTQTVDKLDVNETLESNKPYVFPKLEFLNKNTGISNRNNDMELIENSQKLIDTLKSFNIGAQVINISQGPAVTRYELSIDEGIKVNKITALADNLALSLAATSVRIEAPIPGKSAVGIEIPNATVSSVLLSEVICDTRFRDSKSKVSFGMGKDIAGNVIVSDIAKMPHLLVAGQTGSGKSVCVNTIISSILYKANPDEVKLIMVDPKVVELSVYNGIPHLLVPVITEPDKAKAALDWSVVEMDNRYNLMAKFGVRNLQGYNKIMEENGLKKLPQIVIIIDELADLMMVSSKKEIEAAICRLAQKARAAGLHIIIATQRPSTDVITGLIKANIPSRIAFAVSSNIDSRTILDCVGAEKLLGKGDMLFKPVDRNDPLRIQGAFISDEEVEKIVGFIKENNEVHYDEDIINKINSGSESSSDSSDFGSDDLTDQVIGFLVRKGKGSTSLIQRKFQIGYNRAARIMEELEDRGIVGPASSSGSKQRDVLMDKFQYEEYCTHKKDYI